MIFNDYSNIGHLYIQFQTLLSYAKIQMFILLVL